MVVSHFLVHIVQYLTQLNNVLKYLRAIFSIFEKSMIVILLPCSEKNTEVKLNNLQRTKVPVGSSEAIGVDFLVYSDRKYQDFDISTVISQNM